MSERLTPEDLRRMAVVAVLRGDDPDAVTERARQLLESGIAVEITFTVPDAARVIADLCDVGGGLIGAGTIVTPNQAKQAVAAGAQFLVSPVAPDFLLAMAPRVGPLVIPGAATPSEIQRCVHGGASMVKVFPASSLGGPAYFEQVLKPLGGIRLMASGGVGTDDAFAYLAAGAWCVAVGSGVDAEWAADLAARAAELRAGAPLPDT